MYWRFRLNSKHGYALRDESEDPQIPVEMIKGALEDYFYIKTDVKHEKRHPSSLEADKKILENIVICSMGMPLNCVTLTSQFIDHPELFLELFDIITEKKVFHFNHTCISPLVEGNRYFSSWFEPTSLLRAAEWVVAEFEQRITRAYLEHLQNRQSIQVELNPLLKKKSIRKIWRNFTHEEQEKKVLHYTEIFETMRGLESVKEKEKVIDITRNMIMTLKQENHIEITRVVEYALRYKRRKDPTAFIDSILFPTLEQAGSIVRFYMYYLGKDMLAAIGMWDIDENPALDSPPQEKNQEDKKAKKNPKPSKKKNKKTSPGKGHNPTTGTSENEDHITEFGSKDKRSDGGGLFDPKVEAEIEMMKWDRITDIADDSWIPVDEKKRKQISTRPPKPMATKDSTKSSAYRSDAENKKTLSSKKSKKKSISQARSVNSEGRSEEKIGAEIDSKRDNLIENGKLLDIDGRSDDRNTRDYQYVMKVKPKQSIESNYSEYKVKDLGSQKSDSNPEVQSSLGSLETESIGISTDYKKSTTIDGGSQKVENPKAPKQSKLRGPGQSKPFIHFEAQNELNLNGILKSPGPLGLFSTPVVTIEKPGLLQSKLITTMSDSDKKFFIYLNKSIGSLLEEVDQYSGRMKQIYTILLERTKKVIKHVFPGKNNLDAVVYGSFATDLLVAYSDMDVCITGFDRMNRSQALEILKTLSEKMEMFEWCSEIKYISGATVPVVKITADCSVSFDSFKLDDVWVNSFKESFSDKEVEALALPSQIVYPGDHNKVLVDITVEYLNPFGLPENGGMRTSTFIKDCLKAYPAMRSQVLLFKWIMSIWGLNKTFTAGLSSYCISLMVLAYLQLNKMVTHDNPGDLFIQLLKFYGKDFNPKKQGIWPNLIQCTDFRCPIFEFQAPNESVPLVLLDPTSFMIVNLAIKSEMAPVAFKKFAELHDSLISFKQEMAKQTAKQTSDLPRNILAKLVLGMDL